jgi:hypothetical protein
MPATGENLTGRVSAPVVKPPWLALSPRCIVNDQFSCRHIPLYTRLTLRSLFCCLISEAVALGAIVCTAVL